MIIILENVLLKDKEFKNVIGNIFLNKTILSNDTTDTKNDDKKDSNIPVEKNKVMIKKKVEKKKIPRIITFGRNKSNKELFSGISFIKF